MLLLTLFLSFLFLLVSENLLLLLLLLEIYGFMIIYHVVNLTHFYVFSDFFCFNIFLCLCNSSGDSPLWFNFFSEAYWSWLS